MVKPVAAGLIVTVNDKRGATYPYRETAKRLITALMLEAEEKVTFLGGSFARTSTYLERT